MVPPPGPPAALPQGGARVAVHSPQRSAADAPPLPVQPAGEHQVHSPQLLAQGVLPCAPVCSRPASGTPSSRDTQRSSPQRGSPSLCSVLGSPGAPLPAARGATCRAGAVRAVLVLFQPVLPAGGGVPVLPAAHARASLLVRRAARLRARRHHEQGGVRRPPPLPRGSNDQPAELHVAAAWRDRCHGAGARAGRHRGAGAADTDQPARACGRRAAAYLGEEWRCLRAHRPARR